MTRQRVSLRESMRKAMKANHVGGDSALLYIPVAVWYWMVGEPVVDDDSGEDALLGDGRIDLAPLCE